MEFEPGLANSISLYIFFPPTCWVPGNSSQIINTRKDKSKIQTQLPGGLREKHSQEWY